MKKTRIRNLNNWPPEAGGPFVPGDVLRVGTNEAMVSKFHENKGCRVAFECSFAGKGHTYDFIADEEDVASRVAEIIKNNVGKSLEAIGEMEIDL